MTSGTAIERVVKNPAALTAAVHTELKLECIDFEAVVSAVDGLGDVLTVGVS